MKIGDSVKRTTGACYEKGCTGLIIAVDAEKGRFQIKWVSHPSGEICKPGEKNNTWMSGKALTAI